VTADNNTDQNCSVQSVVKSSFQATKSIEKCWSPILLSQTPAEAAGPNTKYKIPVHCVVCLFTSHLHWLVHVCEQLANNCTWMWSGWKMNMLSLTTSEESYLWHGKHGECSSERKTGKSKHITVMTVYSTAHFRYRTNWLSWIKKKHKISAADFSNNAGVYLQRVNTNSEMRHKQK